MAPHEAVAVLDPPPRYVSRGGQKLAAALTRFGVDLRGRRVLDAGSSTGGFTDCALQAGAAEVIALDVGRGQLHQRLRTDPRVRVHERTNLRHLGAGDLGRPADAVVADLSFISLRTVIPNLSELAAPDADFVLLVKPQFEASRPEVDAGAGVIVDPTIWRRVLGEVAAALDAAGAAIMGAMISPLRGAEGNTEFLLHAVRLADRSPEAPDQGRLLDGAVREAAGS